LFYIVKKTDIENDLETIESIIKKKFNTAFYIREYSVAETCK